MESTDLAALAGLLAALSVAAERLVEIVKKFYPELDEKQPDSNDERGRQLKLLFLSIGAGIVVAAGSLYGLREASPIDKLMGGDLWQNLVAAIVLGILSSGGSSFWNSVATYANKVKDLKAEEAEHQRLRGRSLRRRLGREAIAAQERE